MTVDINRIKELALVVQMDSIDEIDYRKLLKSYMRLVIEMEDTDYIGYAGPNGLAYFSQAELDELYRISKALQDE